jgi:hypothetical protein
MRYFSLLVTLFFFSCHSGDIPRVLIFSKTEGYRHDCIPAATHALRKMCNAKRVLPLIPPKMPAHSMKPI